MTEIHIIISSDFDLSMNFNPKFSRDQAGFNLQAPNEAMGCDAFYRVSWRII